MTKRKETKVDEAHSYGLLIDSREIFFVGDIDDSALDLFVKNLRLLEGQSNLPITIYFSTVGGDLHAGLGIFDIINSCESEITILVPGFLYSAGTLILQAADHRVAYANTWFLLHDGSSYVPDMKHRDFIPTSKFMEKANQQMYEIYADRISQTLKEDPQKVKKMLRGKLSSEWYLAADEALQVGIIDEVR